jgi:C4-dicarboxylate-specific signal transduction histidine kinase
MVTSIAHEVNQPLAAVVTNAEACRRWLDGKAPNLSEAHESLALIVRDANRASGVIQRIRHFLTKNSQQLAPLDVNSVIREALDFGRDQLVKNQVAVRAELADALPAVRGDRIQLQQVMLNLIMNGADAMASVEDWDRVLVVISERSGADAIRVAVRDSGCGVSREDMSRIFNAFFTTKLAGIGMGLSISRSIIEAHGGRIWAESNDGSGLTVQFILPVENGNPR